MTVFWLKQKLDHEIEREVGGALQDFKVPEPSSLLKRSQDATTDALAKLYAEELRLDDEIARLTHEREELRIVKDAYTRASEALFAGQVAAE